MRYKALFIGFLLAAIPLFGWKAELRVDGGREHNLFLGMEPSATALFDREIDKVSPPPPPFGFYCFFPIKDGTYEFLTALWGDMRAPSNEAVWTVLLKRVEKPVQVVIFKLPQIGLLKINGIEVVAESLAMTFGKSESLLTIEYIGGFAQSGKDTISFMNKIPGWFETTVRDNSGKELRKFQEIYLRDGNQILVWDCKNNDGNIIPNGEYRVVFAPIKGSNAAKIEIGVTVKE
jgi:hypothetical protein